MAGFEFPDDRSRSSAAMCRRASSGASAEEVLARADADGAPFAAAEPLRAFVTRGLEELAGDA